MFIDIKINIRLFNNLIILGFLIILLTPATKSSIIYQSLQNLTEPSNSILGIDITDDNSKLVIGDSATITNIYNLDNDVFTYN